MGCHHLSNMIMKRFGWYGTVSGFITTGRLVNIYMTQVPTAANAVRLGRLGKQILLLLGRLLPSGDQSNRRRSMVHTSLALIERHL